MNSEALLESKELRNKCVERYDVLDKVKGLLLLPEMDCANVKQVANYYEVGIEAIQSLYKDNKQELDEDGVHLKSYKDFLNVQEGQLKTGRGASVLTMENGDIVTIPNRGLKVFPRRAILRVGMLLRDSEVAREVRTQLLNIEEPIDEETKVADINVEQGLYIAVGMAVASGDINALANATTNLMDFKNRHIKQLELDKKGLAGEILSWNDRSKLNAGIRKLSSELHVPFGHMWGELYKHLLYKYGINLKNRGDKSKPYIKHIKEEEWSKVIKTFCSLCEYYHKSPADMFQEKMLE